MLLHRGDCRARGSEGRIVPPEQRRPDMNRVIFMVVMLLVLSVCLVCAREKGPAGSNAQELMRKDAKKLTYQGQIDKANELLGGGDMDKINETLAGAGKSSGKAANDGWDMTSLMLGMIWGAFGTAYFVYGKKQSRFAFILCGIGLCLFPLFVSDNTIGLILGLGMTIAPFKLDF
jgi:hypothetical protein